MSKSKLRLTFATSDYEHVRDLSMGPVEAEGLDLNCLTLQIEEMFHRFINFNEFDISEISSGKYTSLISQGDDRYVGLPIFPSRVFRQSSVYIRADSAVVYGSVINVVARLKEMGVNYLGLVTSPVDTDKLRSGK